MLHACIHSMRAQLHTAVRVLPAAYGLQTNRRVENALALKTQRLVTVQRELDIQRAFLREERSAQMPKLPGGELGDVRQSLLACTVGRFSL